MFLKQLNDFLTYLESERGYSKNTQITYSNGLKKFIAFLLVEEIHSFSEVDEPAFIRFMHSLEVSGLCQNSIRLVVESCKSFFKFLKRESVINENPLFLIGRNKIWSKIPQILSIEEIEIIIDSLDFDDEMELLYRAIIEILYGSGLRISELCNLFASDFNDGMVRVRCAKGGKDRLVPCSKVSLNTLNEYWKKYRDPFPQGSNFAFINTRSRLPLTRNQVYCKIKRIVGKCKIEKKISPHTFRHAFATHLIRNKADIRVVQEMLGHSSINSTSIYIQLALEDIQRKFKECHRRY